MSDNNEKTNQDQWSHRTFRLGGSSSVHISRQGASDRVVLQGIYGGPDCDADYARELGAALVTAGCDLKRELRSGYEEDAQILTDAVMVAECPECFGHGTLDGTALVAMVLELRAANGELHDAMAGQQASHEAEMLDAARSSLVRLCRELDLPIYEDPRNGIRGLQTDMAVLRDWLADSQGHVTYLKTLLRSAIETMRKAKNSGFAEIAAFCVEGRLSAARDMAVSWIAEMEAQASALEDDHG